jgi:photosystem II stability/assembly factor-like uncharacterized protein
MGVISMKKFFAICFIFVFTVIVSETNGQTSPEWKWLHPKPQGQYLRWVQAVDANIWVAAGDYGNFLKTTNAGANWVTSTGGYPSSLYPGANIFQNFLCGKFFNANTGYLGVQAVRGIVKTTNGGQTFDTVQIVPSGSGSANAMYFFNQLTGFVAGNSVFKIQRTTNGGTNWLMMPNLGTSTLSAIHAWDTANVITGGSTSGKLFKTSNSGTTWDTINLGVTSTIYNIKFISSTIGFLCGSSGLFRVTTNGGMNWAGVNPPTTSSLYSIAVSGSDVYVSGYTSSTQDLFKTTDNGATWTSVSFAGAASITGFNTYSMDKSGSNFMLVGTYGEIIRSTNTGANWSNLMYRRSLANLTDLYANSSGRVIAVGVDNGIPDVITYSTDRGTTWNNANYIATDYINTISMLNANTGFISGRWGRFAKTTDGGVTWDTSKTANPALVPYFCNGVDFVNETTGWIVGGVAGIGGNTKIWKTTNGGVNWVEQVSAYSGPVGVKISMVDANTGYMSHGAGFQKTTNGGDNWILTTPPSTISTSYNPVKVLNANTVFTSSSNSQVYCTTNGGTSWDSLNFPVKAGTLFCTDWFDYNNGVAGGVIGVVGRTTNHGQTWQIYNTGGYTTMGVQMVHPDTIFAVSGNTYGAQIFKYSKGPVTGGFFYEHKVPTDYTLKQNYPNPFNPVTTIEFDLVKAGSVSLKIFDLSGREYSSEIRNLNLISGNYKMNFNGAGLSSGVYFYSLIVNGTNIATKRMMMIK